MSYVTVLTPNGRRQNVKITPNTTLLQVLEEVCAKHGFKPEEYDLRHHNKILDVSSIFRFSGLPNNAFLEMTEATRQRLESPVVLGLHLESGDRLTGEFSPSESLWSVILKLSPESKSFPNPVVIYMRKEVCGKENLEKTTLRSLGLTGGRAILRFFNRTPEELRTQANVSEVLSRTFIPKDAKSEASDKRYVNDRAKSPQKKAEKYPDDNNIQQKEVEIKSESSRESHSNVKVKGEEKKVVLEKVQPNVMEEPRSSVQQKKEMETHKLTVDDIGTELAGEEKNKVILLGERNAVAYNLNTVKPVIVEDIPDDFYELTVSDAKLLLRDAKQLCADLENAPLMTSAQRELEKNKKILSLLNQYKKTVLRIKFPDRTVLQGTFSSVEKVANVEKFVASYLQNPDSQFYLYTTPPKERLKSDSNLLECNCVPCAVLYFGLTSEAPEAKHYLRSDVLEKFSSPSAAALTAYQSRGLFLSPKKNAKETANVETVRSNASIPEPSTSTSSQDGQPQEQGSSPPFKVPKWFKARK
ncbi:UNVERIFIED_CONTAM: hypothetical protein PYX00_007925 [Menopon gallinae]|uniref:Tether containing UBX domain for GLUT4 n=1 Tax=Menopon gallinae TaxID=328185 RepID=A0AAW2HM70_9NEOP